MPWNIPGNVMAYLLCFSFFKKYTMVKYSKKSQDKVEKTMHELKHGKLKSGTGKKVTSRKQAIAIGLSEARKAGAKVPPKKSASRKSAPKKSTARKSAAKKKSSPGKSM